MRALFFAAAVVAVGACRSPLGPESQVAGTYVLESVGGQAVPYVMTDDPAISIAGRVVELSDRGSFTDRVELNVLDREASTRLPLERVGTFFSIGTDVTLTYADGHASRAIAEGGRLTLDDRGLIFVLRR